MNMYKIFIVLSLSLFLLGVGGCNVSDYQKSIYSDNSKIAKEADSYTFNNRIGSTNKNETNIEFSAFTGMETIWIIEVKEEGSVSVNYESKIENGDFKTVLISPNGVLTNIFEQSKSGTSTLNLQKGKNRIKIVGNDAKGEVTLLIKIDEDMQIYNLT